MSSTFCTHSSPLSSISPSPPMDYEPASSSPMQPPSLLPSDIITLDVSGRKFKCRKSTLQDCSWFSNLFSRWHTGLDIQADGSVFIDGDPDAFPIILNYIRRPTVFPLLWTREKGFDYVLYTKVLADADFFCLDELRDCIRAEKYRGAVKTEHSVEVLPAESGPARYDTRGALSVPAELQSDDGDWELERSYAIEVKSRVGFSCPAGHHWRAEECECWEDRGLFAEPMDDLSQESPWSDVAIWKHTVIDPKVCYKS
ncbi:hypothetical protein BDV95DRAFT_584435 [Massariosphaeria phaeospora]|uniref:BTB domain-containing protein n=1 Tax=Massariosphaeria phaeospora TaxID=100035 RepID=A0A7C8I7C4_9PLEO|nr:hypothetical protein BDV95DRAFT_584435 [Massariosphaeria phaeospora]